MVEKDRDKELARLTKELAGSFRRWDNLFQNGGSDPHWPDGMGLNMIRGHIMSYKKDIEKIVSEINSEMSLFGPEYPDIYYRETPSEVPGDYMAKADEIRQRATEQLALYEQDPNYHYCLENHKKIFEKGETKATKAAGLSIWPTAAMGKYRKSFESGDLVAMRRDFYGSYEEKAARWAEYAQAMKAYLEMENGEWTVGNCGVAELANSATISNNSEVLSLEEQIENAKDKGSDSEKKVPKKEEQLSLF